MNEFTKLILDYPLAAVGIAFVLGYFICFKGIGLSFVQGIADRLSPKPVAGAPQTPPQAVAPAPAQADKPAPVVPVHPAVAVLQAGIDNGNAAAVMPAVQAMVNPPNPAA
ncbi:MAG TPA: hypothetical protein VFE62_20980 [Gemmataceae bacterium]|nr:hypothetical protein [Gemmataceae bacterium]